MSRSAKITVITPMGTATHLPQRCLNSVLGQNYPSLEYLVIGDNSAGQSLEIIADHPDITISTIPSGHKASQINHALQLASGDLIGVLEADQVYLPNAFTSVLKQLNQNVGDHVYYGKAILCNMRTGANQWIRSHGEPNLQSLLRWWHTNLIQSSVFIPKQIISQVGELRVDLECGADYEYWLRIAQYGFPFRLVDKVLSRSPDDIYHSGSLNLPRLPSSNCLEISLIYLKDRSKHSKMCFWKDYYQFVISNNIQDARFSSVSQETSEEELIGLGHALSNNGLLNLEIITSFVSSNPKSPELHSLFGEFLAKNKHEGEASTYFEKALALGYKFYLSSRKNLVNGSLHLPKRNQNKKAIFICHQELNTQAEIIQKVYLSDLLTLKNSGFDVTTITTLNNNSPQEIRKERAFFENLGINLEVVSIDLTTKDLRLLQTTGTPHIPPALHRSFSELYKNTNPSIVFFADTNYAGLAKSKYLKQSLKILRASSVWREDHRIERLSANGQYGIPISSSGSFPKNILGEIFRAALNPSPSNDLHEYNLYNHFDRVLTIFAEDNTRLLKLTRNTQIHHYLPNLSFSCQGSPPSQNPVMILGESAVDFYCYLFFVNEILPDLLSACPEFRITVFNNSSMRIPPHPNVSIREEGNLDLNCSGATFIICPLFNTFPAKLKIAYGLANQLPIVTMSHSGDHEHAQGSNCLIANTVSEFIQLIGQLYHNNPSFQESRTTFYHRQYEDLDSHSQAELWSKIVEIS